jgi:hypothetical protein
MDPKTGRPLHPSRRERDTNGDGHVDQWWTWQGTKVSIARDTSGDGKPDPASTVVLDQGAAEVDAGAAAPDASKAAGDAMAVATPAEAGTSDGGRR